MKTITTLILALVCLCSYSQLTHTINLADVTTDSTYFFTKDNTKYSNAMGMTLLSQNITGTSGTIDLLHGATDSTYVILDTYTVISDTVFVKVGDSTPVERYGFKVTKGTLSAGTITLYYSRKTSK